MSPDHFWMATSAARLTSTTASTITNSSASPTTTAQGLQNRAAGVWHRLQPYSIRLSRFVKPTLAAGPGGDRLRRSRGRRRLRLGLRFRAHFQMALEKRTLLHDERAGLNLTVNSTSW